MANPTTTHVIEIETGIGEPAFIPLSMGHELQPISVGKKGMWRLESPRVLDVHAFVYYDGTSLFLQSADEQNAASVDGYRVGKAWTELHAPCMIEVGTARLRYRSLIADSDNQPTMMQMSPPVQAPPGGPGGGPGGAGGPPAATGSRPGTGQSVAAPMPAAGTPPPPNGGAMNRTAHLGNNGMGQSGPRPTASAAPAPAQQQSGSGPVAFPKAERPFKPGEFSSAPDVDESTRIAPLESTGAGRAAQGGPRPAAGQPAGGDDPSTRPDAVRLVRGATGAVAAIPGSGPYGAMNNVPPGMGSQPGAGMGSQPGAGMGSQPGAGMGSQPGAGMMPPNMMQQGYDPQQQAYAQQQGYPQQQPQGYGGQPGFGPMGPGGMPPIPGPPGVPGAMGGFGSMTPQGGMQHPAAPQNPMDAFVAKLKANSIPKMIAGALFVIGGILYLVEDDEPQVQPKRKNIAVLDGGAAEGGLAAGNGAGGSTTPPTGTVPPIMPTQPTAPANNWPAGVPCPPPNWPPNTPLPCTPNNVGPGPTETAPTSPPTGGKPPKDPKDAGAKEPKDAGATLPAGTKTLERQAVDYVAGGETAKAAAAYEELVRRDPNNKVYAEAARILRAKLDGGTPAQ